MKKIVFCFFILLSSQICFAGINRTLYGLTLGKTTKAEAMELLLSKGLSFDRQNENELGLLVTAKGDISFGGVKWNNIAVVFNDNVVASVIFSLDFLDYDEARSTSSLLFNSLYNKYSAYGKAKETEITETRSGVIAHVVFRDDQNTTVVLDMDLDIYSLSNLLLTYVDDSYMQDKVKGNQDEL